MYWDNVYMGITVNELMLNHFRHPQLFATPWMVAHQAPSVHGILQTSFQVIFLIQGMNLHLLCFLLWHVGTFSLVPLGKPTGISVPSSKFCCKPKTSIKNNTAPQMDKCNKTMVLVIIKIIFFSFH